MLTSVEEIILILSLTVNIEVTPFFTFTPTYLLVIVLSFHLPSLCKKPLVVKQFGLIGLWYMLTQIRYPCPVLGRPKKGDVNISTVGVDVCDWFYPKKTDFAFGRADNRPSIKFSTWDFGGQVSNVG